MQDVLDLAATMITSEVKADATVTIKLVWASAGGNARIRTFLRNTRSHGLRDAYDSPDDYAYTDNTAFQVILSGSAETFASDNLILEESAGRYRNINNCWMDYYNNTYVVPIPPRSPADRAVAGFLCADTRYGVMNTPKVAAALASMSQYLYYLFGLCVSIVEPSAVGVSGFDEMEAERSMRFPRIGCVLEGDRLVAAEYEHQRTFQSAITLLAELDQQKSDARAATSSGVEGRRRIGWPGPEGDQAMSDQTPSWVKFVTEEDIDPVDRAAIKLAERTTEAEHLAFMDRIASTNSYAEAFVNRARSK
jgi:hypothetical protein